MKSMLLSCFILVLAGTAHADAGAVTFAVIGDRTGGHVEGIYGQVVAEVAALGPEFAITVGDQIEGYTEDTTELRVQWEEYDSIVAALPVPLHFTPGNHDITNDVMVPYYREHAGEPYYSFDHRGLHVIVLDNSRRESPQGFDEEQVEWLVEDLVDNADADYTLVFYHKPFWFELVARGRADPLHGTFVEHGVDAVFTGHYHRYFSGVIDGVAYTSVGSSGGSTDPGPTGIRYHYLTVTAHDGVLDLQPVLLGGEERPWDDVTVDDVLAIERIDRTGMRFPDPLVLDDELTAEGTVRLVVGNPVEGVGIDDRLNWDLPDGWTAEPTSLPIKVPAGGSQTVEFKLRCTGDPFPVPEAKLWIPYGEGKPHGFATPLRVARTAKCPTGPGIPVVDGRVDDECWQDPETVLFAYGGGKAKTDPAEFYFAHDGGNLYVAASCSDEEPGSAASSASKRDGAVYADDCVGYFFQPDTSERVVYQVYANPDGVVFDQRIVIREDGSWEADPDWNGEYEVGTAREADGWGIEMRIPLDQLAAGIGTWGVNFRRKQPRLGNGDWQVPISYDPGTYGLLVFE